MEEEGAKLINTRQQLGPGIKSLLLRVQMVASALIIFFGIIQATNLYLLNAAQDNPITFGLFVTLVVVIALSCFTIFWAIQSSKRLSVSTSSDSGTNTTDSQILLFITLICFVIYLVYFVVLRFAKDDLFNAAQASSVEVNTSFLNSFNQHSQWITVFGYLILSLLVFTAFTIEVMTDSRRCANLMIFLFSTTLVFLTYSILHNIGVLHSIFDYPTYAVSESPLSIIKTSLLLSLLLLILGIFVNSKRKEVSYLLLGSLLLVSLTLIVPATGHLFRQHTSVSAYFQGTCAEHLGHIEAKYLSQQGCTNKYLYKDNSPKDCGSHFEDCFESIENMRKRNAEPKSFITTVWEPSLYPKASSAPRFAGLSPQCCGTVVNIYARPLLKIAALSLAYITITFILVCFFFKNSTHAYQDNEPLLSGSIKTILIGVFAAFILIGGLFSIISSHSSDIVRRDTVAVNNKLISIHHSNPTNTYHEINKCTLFQYFEDESLVDADYKNILLSELSVSKAATTYCENCTNPDLLVVIQTVRGQSDSCPTDFKFNYPLNLAAADPTHRTHIIPSSLAQPLANDSVCFDAATKHNRCVPCQNYIGVVGDPNAVINLIRTQIAACNRQGLKFVVQTFQVDQKLFAAKQSQKQSKQLTFEESGETISKSLNHHGHGRARKPNKGSVDPKSEKTSNSVLITPPTRMLAQLSKHTIELSVRDIVTNAALSGATVKLYENYEGDNTCDASSNAKLIHSGETNAAGQFSLDFLYTQVPATRYTVEVRHDKSKYSVNCRSFTINEKRKFLDVGLSPQLGEHQIRFVLEWGSESASDTTSDLDLYLNANAASGSEASAGAVATSNASNSDSWVCYASYFSATCAGAQYHGDSRGDHVSSEAITIEKLGQVKYLVFFKMPLVSATNGAVDNSVITQLKPLVKVYTHGQNKPTQTAIFDPAIDKGTSIDYEKNYRFANLAWCVNGVNSEIVKSAKGFSYPVSWQTADPEVAQAYDLPLSSASCT